MDQILYLIFITLYFIGTLNTLKQFDLEILKLNESLEKITKKLSNENVVNAAKAGNVAKVALKELESKTGKKVVSSLNAKNFLGIQETEPKKKIGSINKKK